MIETYSEGVNNVLMKNQETGEVNYPAVFIAFGIPIVLIIMVIRYAFDQGLKEAEAAAKKVEKKQK